MLTVSNALLLSSATVSVRSGGLFWLKPVAMVLFMLCSAVCRVVSFEAMLCGMLFVMLFVMYGMLFVMYGISVLLSLTEVRWVGMMCLCSCLCLGFGIGMFSSFHV